MRSTASRRSKWGDDDAEPLGEVKRRQFEDVSDEEVSRADPQFHANNGVRTVVGAVGDVQGVRMLLKQGYRGVYVSRSFAVRHGLISRKERPGFGGYGGLVMLGNVPITVGEKTALHPVMLSEEQHFDVVLGRSWIEKMNIKWVTLTGVRKANIQGRPLGPHGAHLHGHRRDHPVRPCCAPRREGTDYHHHLEHYRLDRGTAARSLYLSFIILVPQIVRDTSIHLACKMSHSSISLYDRCMNASAVAGRSWGVGHRAGRKAETTAMPIHVAELRGSNVTARYCDCDYPTAKTTLNSTSLVELHSFWPLLLLTPSL